jgi:hypothetical protein
MLKTAVSTGVWNDELARYENKIDSFHIVNGSVITDFCIVMPNTLPKQA